MTALVLAGLIAASSSSSEPPARARDFVTRFGSFQQATATPADVDRFLEPCTDELSYEHPRVGAVIRGKAEVRKDHLSHLGETRGDQTRLVEWVEGPNVLVLRLDRTFEVRDGNGWKPVHRGSVMVLDLDASGRIRRIVDFW